MKRRKPLRVKQMQKPEEPTITQQPQSIEQVMNTVLSSIIAKHQHAIYAQLMELQKSLQQQPKKETDEKN